MNLSDLYFDRNGSWKVNTKINAYSSKMKKGGLNWKVFGVLY